MTAGDKNVIIKANNGRDGQNERKCKANIIDCRICVGWNFSGMDCGGFSAKSISDPEMIQFWLENNLAVPEPIPTEQCCIGFALLFAGMPTGFILMRNTLGRWLTPTAPRWLFFFLGFPIYTVLGAAAVLPFVVWKLILLIKSRKTTGREMRENPHVS